MGAEAQLRAKGSVAGLGSNPINIHSSAELRHPSNASSTSSLLNNAAGLDLGAGSGGDALSSHAAASASAPAGGAGTMGVGGMNGMSGMNGVNGMSGVPGGSPHMMYQQANLLTKLQQAASQDSNTRRLLATLLTQAQAATSTTTPSSFGESRTSRFLASLEDPDLHAQLPAFVKPLPSRIASEDVKYLHMKGALSLPNHPLQTALLQAYVEYVHPYMPLVDLNEFLAIVNSREGLCGQVSLFLYQAVMFAATAFVDMKALREAGYSTRKAARRSFFQKTRVSLAVPPCGPRAPGSPSPTLAGVGVMLLGALIFTCFFSL